MVRSSLAVAAIGIFFAAQSATAASWSVISFTTTPQNTPKILAAGDKLMMSAAGKTFPGRLVLSQNVADGDNPATHAWVPVYKSAADREAFVQKLQADPAWDEFITTIQALSQPGGTTLYRTVKSWGDVVDSDTVWMTHSLRVSDPATFLSALETFRSSPTGQKFTGQVHVSAVAAGGMTPVTHIISVGYASEAEMEAWADTRSASADWAAYVKVARPVSEYLGGSLGRNLKAWGPGKLADLTAP
jgi:hypothetical protein